MPRLLLIGWDAADWRLLRPLMQAGDMPVLKRLVETGFSGNLRTLEPMLSPMLWTSIATGKRAAEHGVLGFTEVDSLTREVRPVSAATRKCAAVWNILAAHGYSCNVIGWFATQGEEIPRGSVVSNAFPVPTAGPGKEWPPAPPGTISPESDVEVLNSLRVSPEQIDGDVISLFCPKYREIDTEQDHLINHLRVHLAEAFSIQAAACWTLRNRPGDFVGVYFRAMDEIAHHFMHFHPPRMAGIPEREFSLYSEVMRATCRLHDRLLAQLIALAPEDTHVMLVSDHGFHCDHLRPKVTPRVTAGITVWHRKQGIIAGYGDRFKSGHAVQGAGLLDVVPTILQLFGIPAGKDMPGRF
ncbi:MAG: alkaline phosphatase family protein [Verrucomicrobia bacterium]|nr:alkaline phosphatase family protein [Verrucomicrobiota bacterium]